MQCWHVCSLNDWEWVTHFLHFHDSLSGWIWAQGPGSLFYPFRFCGHKSWYDKRALRKSYLAMTQNLKKTLNSAILQTPFSRNPKRCMWRRTTKHIHLLHENLASTSVSISSPHWAKLEFVKGCVPAVGKPTWTSLLFMHIHGEIRQVRGKPHQTKEAKTWHLPFSWDSDQVQDIPQAWWLSSRCPFLHLFEGRMRQRKKISRAAKGLLRNCHPRGCRAYPFSC